MSDFEMLTPETLTVQNVEEIQKSVLDGENFWDKILPYRQERYVKHGLRLEQMLAQIPDPHIHKYLAYNPHTRLETLNFITGTTKTFVPQFLKQIAAHPNTDQELIQYLTNIVPRNKLPVIARNIGAHLPDQLFIDWITGVFLCQELGEVIANPNLPKHILIPYSKNITTVRSWVSELLAQNPALPVEAMERVVSGGQEMWSQRQKLILNRNCPPELLTKMWNESITKKDSTRIAAIHDAGWLKGATNTIACLWLNENHWLNYDHKISKSGKILVLQKYYPELSDNVPEEWVDKLLETLPDDIFTFTPEDFKVVS